MKVSIKLIIPLSVFFYCACSSGVKKVGPAENVSIESTPERMTRGKYLAMHVSSCIDCHSTRDYKLFAGPLVPGTEGMGGEHYGKEMGVPGDVYSDNITPAAIGDWTDGEVIRATVCGLGINNEPLVPLMPYPAYAKFTREDLYSIVVYIRSLKPIRNNVPDSKLKFPYSTFLKTVPDPAEYTINIDKNNSVEYGEYLVTIAACGDCHTLRKLGKFNEKKKLSGGLEMPLPEGSVVRATNLTPDPETGLGLDKKTFIYKFKRFEDPDFWNEPITRGEYNTYMPWRMYAGITEEDLGAIYDYLQTIPPVKNEVVVFSKKKPIN